MLQKRLTKLYAEAAVVPGAVDLMTIHAAKGLEWDVVLVPGLERRAQSSRGRLLTWDEIDQDDEEAAQVVLAPIAGKGESNRELNVWLNGIHNAREAAERKRLFYVVCTRAREELHLFASPETKSGWGGEPSRGKSVAIGVASGGGAFCRGCGVRVQVGKGAGDGRFVGESCGWWEDLEMERPASA